MDRRAFTASAAAGLLLGGCASAPNGKFQNYYGPRVTSVVVNKGARRMYLLNGNDILKKYTVDLGFAPLGHKRIEGDGKTPEGQYFINRRNPDSAFHLSIGISYPNAQDRARARAMGRSPGGEIFIHGQPNLLKARKRAERVSDWTAGCIAVKNREMEEVYAMVKTGTPIFLNA